MKGFIILLFITIWCCTVLGKSDIAKRGNSNNLSKENRIVETDEHEAKTKARAMNKAKNSKHKSNVGSKFWGKKDHPDDFHNHKVYNLDSVLNGLETRRREWTSSESLSRSSSRELKDWKMEWKELWKKRLARMKNITDPGGDRINMIAARPWGAPCGDPAQHDFPWGSCVLPAECDGEFRVYRGDNFCGRTQFVCCALAFTTYDNYQGFDVSLADTSMEKDSAELRLKKTKSSEASALHRAKKKRKRLREERKYKLKKTIRKIMKEMHNILDQLYKNASHVRRKKTRLMQKFITYIKRVYKKDRISLMNLHEYNLYTVDRNLYEKLMEIKSLDKDFMKNDTFREIILSKIMTIKSARMLVDTYPQLKELVEKDLTRRVEGGATPIPAHVRPGRKIARRGGYVAHRRRRRRKYLDYDVEYGLLYS